MRWSNRRNFFCTICLPSLVQICWRSISCRPLLPRSRNYVPFQKWIRLIRLERERSEKFFWEGQKLLRLECLPRSNRPRFPSAVPSAVGFSTRTPPPARSVKGNSTYAAFGVLALIIIIIIIKLLPVAVDLWLAVFCESLCTKLGQLFGSQWCQIILVCFFLCHPVSTYSQAFLSLSLCHPVTVLFVVYLAGARCVAMGATSCTWRNGLASITGVPLGAAILAWLRKMLYHCRFWLHTVFYCVELSLRHSICKNLHNVPVHIMHQFALFQILPGYVWS